MTRLSRFITLVAVVIVCNCGSAAPSTNKIPKKQQYITDVSKPVDAFGISEKENTAQPPVVAEQPEPVDAGVLPSAPADKALPDLALEVWPPNQLDEWRITNKSDVQICGVSRARVYGDANIEFAEWPGILFPTACGDASSRVIDSISPGQSRIVHSDLRDGLSSGRYRMVTELRDCQFEKEPDGGDSEIDRLLHFIPQYRLIVEFAVGGYDENEANAIFEMLKEPSIRECKDVIVLVIRHLKKYLPREHVVKAFALKDLTFAQRSAAIELLYQGRLFEQISVREDVVRRQRHIGAP